MIQKKILIITTMNGITVPQAMERLDNAFSRMVTVTSGTDDEIAQEVKQRYEFILIDTDRHIVNLVNSIKDIITIYDMTTQLYSFNGKLAIPGITYISDSLDEFINKQLSQPA